MYVYPHCAFEYSVVSLNRKLLDGDVQLLRQKGGYLVQYSESVDTLHQYRYLKIECAVCVPVGCQYPVAVTALECVCNRAVALVYYDVLLFVVISQDIIAGYGTAAVGYDVAAVQCLVGKFDRMLAIDTLELLCFMLFVSVIFLFAKERE